MGVGPGNAAPGGMIGGRTGDGDGDGDGGGSGVPPS